MNNARYLKILNYSRRAHFYKVGIWPLLQKMKMNVVIACQSIRYKKEIKLWQSFTIRTAIIGYNDKDRSIWVQSWLEEIPSAQTRKSANANLELTEKAANAGMPVVLAVHILKYVVLSTASKSKKNEQPAAADAGTAATGEVATSDSLSTATDAVSVNNTPTPTISRSNSDASEADIWNRPRRASSACEARESGRCVRVHIGVIRNRMCMLLSVQYCVWVCEQYILTSPSSLLPLFFLPPLPKTQRCSGST